MILILYTRLFIALLNKIFHTGTELHVLDSIENRICKNNQKLKSGYTLMIKGRKSAKLSKTWKDPRK